MSTIQRTHTGPGAPDPGQSNPAANGVSGSALALMWFATATLAVVSPLHLAGLIGNGAEFNASAAGIAEAVIAVVLASAATLAWRMPRRARPVAVGAEIFAILGFGLGLSFTARGGGAFDVTYHAVMLPVLVGTLILLLRPRRGTSTTGG